MGNLEADDIDMIDPLAKGSKKRISSFLKIFNNYAVFIFLCAFVSIFITGYTPIKSNINVLIPLQQFKDPTFLANDSAFGNSTGTRGRHALLAILYILSHVFSDPQLMLICFLLYRILLCFGVYKLSFSIGRDQKSACLTILPIFYMVTREVILGGTHMTANQFYPQHLSFAISLFALAYLLEDKGYRAFIVAAVATNTHFMTGTQCFIMIFLYVILRYPRFGWKNICRMVCLYMALASPEVLPVFYQYFFSSLHSQISRTNPRDFIEIWGYIRAPHHLMPNTWTLEQYVRPVLLVALGIWSYVQTRDKSKSMFEALIVCIGVALFILLALPLIYESPTIMLYHPMRMTRWPGVIMFALISRYLVQSFSQGGIGTRLWVVTVVALMRSPYIMLVLFLARSVCAMIKSRKPGFFLGSACGFGLLLLVWWTPRVQPFWEYPSFRLMLSRPVYTSSLWLLFAEMILLVPILIGPRVALILVNASLLTTLLVLWPIVLYRDLTDPTLRPENFAYGFPVLKIDNAKLAACQWIRESTEKDGRLIVFPTLATVRYFANRSILADWTFVSFDANDWIARMNDLSNGQLAVARMEIRQGRTKNIHAAKIVRNGFLTLTGKDMRALGQKYNCQYVLTLKKHQLSLSKLYENERYIVYDLRGKWGAGRKQK